MSRLLAFMLTAALAAPAPVLAARPDDVATIRAIVGGDRGVTAPGCAVGVFEGDKTLFAAAGSVDLATGRRADGDTLFYSGSLGKQFTALAISQLVVAGKLRLDDDIRKVLPEMAASRTPITVEMLLHHTSGLPNHSKLIPLAGYERVGQAPRQETMSTLLAYGETAFPPGATFEYSNGGYLLLSLIVERVSGLPFEDYIAAAILRPLGMTRSLVMRGVTPSDPNMAHGYLPQGAGFVLSEDVPTFGGAGAMMLTINDLAKYHHDIATGHRVWTPQINEMMTRPARYGDGSPVIQPVPGYHFGYASGLMLSRDWVLHGGNYAGFQALIAWLPGTPHGIALLCNRGDAKTPQLATQILAALEPSLPAVDAPRYALPSPTGRYASEVLPVIYQLTETGADLRVAVQGSDGAPRSVSTFTKTAEGAYARGPLAIVFDPDRRGFVASNGAVRVRFHRAP